MRYDQYYAPFTMELFKPPNESSCRFLPKKGQKVKNKIRKKRKGKK